MDIPILYEDKDVLVLNKPSGLMVHGDGRSKEKTLTDWILKKYPKLKNVGEPWKVEREGETIFRPGIVHRLDKETSGVLVIAKNQKTFEFLKEQFSAPALEITKGRLADRKNRVKKTYVALVWGHVKNDEGVIDAPIARSKKDFRQWSAQRGRRGKEREAITEYKVLKHLLMDADGKLINPDISVDQKKISGISSLTLLEVKPRTGRTHQIRVHLKYINHPIVCDKLYAPNMPCPVLGMERLALHAQSIEFMRPDGKDIKIEAPLPADLQTAINIDK